MPKVEITVKLTPDELREILSEPLREVYDELVKSMGEHGFDEDESKMIVANLILQSIKKKRRATG